jgi:DNA-binding NtrC family response regulator
MTDTICFLIDDDIDDQEIFGIAVREFDPSVKCIYADNCIMALEKFEADKSLVPDYIFIDINMPKMNGIHCLKAIKKIDRLSQIPVYMYSTSADPAFVAESKEHGAIDFIVKPTNIKDLSQILAGLFHK